MSASPNVENVTYLPPTSELRLWASHPAKQNGFVPIHPVTLRAIADELDRLRGMEQLRHVLRDCAFMALDAEDPASRQKQDNARQLLRDLEASR